MHNITHRRDKGNVPKKSISVVYFGKKMSTEFDSKDYSLWYICMSKLTQNAEILTWAGLMQILEILWFIKSPRSGIWACCMKLSISKLLEESILWFCLTNMIMGPAYQIWNFFYYHYTNHSSVLGLQMTKWVADACRLRKVASHKCIQTRHC